MIAVGFLKQNGRQFNYICKNNLKNIDLSIFSKGATAVYQALYRKYRPLRFADVVGQSAVTRTLIGQLVGDRIGHAYLFTGTRGTGKTTCAKILARAVNCEHPVNGDPCNECPSCKGILDGSVTDVFEIDAASNNSVDNVRELREDVVYTPALVKYKVYIIDEVHRMSGPAFDALLKTIEEPPSHVIFILATTELHKVPATILSRCQRFDFRRIDAPEIAGRLQYVAEQEGITLTEEAALLLGRMGQGSMRDALSLLERAAALQGQVDAAAVGDLLGLCDPGRLIGAIEDIADHNTGAVLRFLNDMWRDSKDVSRLLGEMAVLLRDIALSDVAPELVASTRSEEEVRRLMALQEKMGRAQVLAALETLQKGMRDIALSGDSRVMTEITLMRMCDPRLDSSAAALTGRVSKLEKWARSVRDGVTVQPAPSAASVTENVPEESALEQPLPPPDKAVCDTPTAPAPRPPAEKETPSVQASPTLWNDTIEMLRQEGRMDLMAMIGETVPEMNGNRVIFRLEKDSFARRMLSADNFKDALLAALQKADGNTHIISFEEPIKEPVSHEGDPLWELAEQLGEDAIME